MYIYTLWLINLSVKDSKYTRTVWTPHFTAGDLHFPYSSSECLNSGMPHFRKLKREPVLEAICSALFTSQITYSKIKVTHKKSEK